VDQAADAACRGALTAELTPDQAADAACRGM